MSKTIGIKDLRTGENFYVEIETNKTVGELKAKIENLLNDKFTGSLLLKRVMIQGYIYLVDLHQTVEDARIHDNDQIIIPKIDVFGG